MATPTYTPIESYTVSGTSTNTITFGSGGTIPQTYTDLIVVASVRQSSTDTLLFRVGNGSLDTGSNYSLTVLKGNGSAATSTRASSLNTFYGDYAGYAPSAASTFAPNIYQFMNYSNTSTYKTVLMRSNNASAGLDAIVGLWRSTSAINTIAFRYESGTTFAAGSTFTLYGISSDPGAVVPKATGGTITSNVGYIFHTFTSSGTFTPLESLTVDYLIVGGAGGASNASNGGGGGAGGLRAFTNQSLTATEYSVVIGAGGASASSGEASSFNSYSSAGGGHGNGGSGGSGGGNVNGSAGGTGNTPSTSPSQGNNGSSGTSAGGGGGGGITSAGDSIYAGDGTSAYSSWGASYLSRGGYGANGSDVGVPGQSGAANSGIGGNGSNYGTGGGSGGSGLVIIRYPKA